MTRSDPILDRLRDLRTRGLLARVAGACERAGVHHTDVVLTTRSARAPRVEAALRRCRLTAARHGQNEQWIAWLFGASEARPSEAEPKKHKPWTQLWLPFYRVRVDRYAEYFKQFAPVGSRPLGLKYSRGQLIDYEGRDEWISECAERALVKWRSERVIKAPAPNRVAPHPIRRRKAA